MDPLFLSLFWLVLLTVPPRLAAQPRSFERLQPYLEQRLPQWMERYRVPGVSLAIIREARPQWIAAFGFADAGLQEALTRQTVFQAGSIAKPLTAWGVMKLVNEGRIELDEPVDRYLSRWHLPDSRFNKRKVTIRRLLNHTAGLPNPEIPPNYDPATRLSPEALLSGSPGNRQPLTLENDPGSTFHYSNAGYTILQLVINEVSGRSFNDYMYGAVLAPLGMQQSNFKWEAVQPEKRATAHDHLGRPAPSEFFSGVAATGLNTTAADLAIFVSAGMPSLRSAVRGYPVLPPKIIEQMQSPQTNISGMGYPEVESYGLGYFVETTSRSYQVVSHSGYNPPGWHAQFFAVPATGDGLVVLTNSANGQLVINAIAKAWSRATGIGRLAITSTHRKITATVWLATLLAAALALYLGRRFITTLRQGRRRLSRRYAFSRLLGVLVLASLLTACWTALPLLLNSWTPQLTLFLLGALSALFALAMLTLLLPQQAAETATRKSTPPEVVEQENEPEK